jgi:hypothetical protein
LENRDKKKKMADVSGRSLRRSNSQTSLLSSSSGEKAAGAAGNRSRLATGTAIAALVLALLGFGLALGLGLGYGPGNASDLRNLRGSLDQLWSETQVALDDLQSEVLDLRGNLTQQNETVQELRLNITLQYQMLQSEIMLLQANIVDGLMNVSGSGGAPYVRTSVQNGTFNWQDKYGLNIPSTYSSDVITIGPLTFQLLTLRPPSTPMIINPLNAGNFDFYLNNFDPFISQLVQLGSGFVFLPLTATNAAKINVTNDNDCFKNYFAPFPPGAKKRTPAPFCYERAVGAPYFATSRNSLAVVAEDFSVAANYYLTGIIEYNPSTLLDGQEFTLLSPWELVLAAF